MPEGGPGDSINNQHAELKYFNCSRATAKSSSSSTSHRPFAERLFACVDRLAISWPNRMSGHAALSSVSTPSRSWRTGLITEGNLRRRDFLLQRLSAAQAPCGAQCGLEHHRGHANIIVGSRTIHRAGFFESISPAFFFSQSDYREFRRPDPARRRSPSRMVYCRASKYSHSGTEYLRVIPQASRS